MYGVGSSSALMRKSANVDESISLVCPVIGLGVIGCSRFDDAVEDRELERDDRERGGGVVIEKLTAFFGVVTSREMGDINPGSSTVRCF
jgi:hypothetical protein